MPAPTGGEGPPSGRGDRPAPLPSGPVGARPPGDGLFEERTELAWTRSGVAILLVVAVLVRRLWPLNDSETTAVLVAVGAGAGLWSAGMALARRGRAAASSGDLSSGVVSTRACRLLTAGTVVLAAAGLVLAVVTPS